jgi:hypothetical protein
VVLFHGGPGDAVAVQFVERNEAIVGKTAMQYSSFLAKTLFLLSVFIV